MDDREHKLYFDRQILPVPDGPTNIPLVDDEQGLGRNHQRDEHITGSGACGFTSIDKAAVSAC